MKIDTDTMARLAFAALLLVGGVGTSAWYFLAADHATRYQLYTPDAVSGLMVDAPVEFHGVEVGKVTRIRLVNPHKVAIVLSIDPSVPITSASIATITSRGLATRGFTGYVYVALEDSGNGGQPLTAPPGEPYPVIATAPSKIVTVDTSIAQVNRNVQLLTERVDTLLDTQTIASLRHSVDSLQQASEVLAANAEKLNTIITRTERASQHVEPLLASSQNTLRALQTQILPEAHQALRRLDALSGTMTTVATKLNRDPSLLLRGTAPPPPGPGEKP